MHNIKFQLTKFNGALVFQVQDMSPEFKDFIKAHPFGFRAQNGWTIKSNATTELDSINKQISLHGPNNIQVVTRYCAHNTARDKHYDEIIVAIQEAVEAYNEFRKIGSRKDGVFAY